MNTSAPSSRNFVAISLPSPVPPPVTRMRCDLRMPSLNTARSLSAMLSASIEANAGEAKPAREGRMASVLDRFRLDRQVAVITGGARGIGRATAEAFVAAGALAVLLDCDLDEAKQAAQALGNAEAHALDVTVEPEVDRFFDELVSRTGRLDVCVNNAGASIRKPTTELSAAEWDKVIAVNQTAVFLCSRAAARHMLARKSGAIVNLASIMGFSGGGLYPNISYQASKGAVVNMTRAMAIEWARDGIRRSEERRVGKECRS